MIWDYWTSMNLLYSIIFCWFLNSTKSGFNQWQQPHLCARRHAPNLWKPALWVFLQSQVGCETEPRLNDSTAFRADMFPGRNLCLPTSPKECDHHFTIHFLTHFRPFISPFISPKEYHFRPFWCSSFPDPNLAVVPHQFTTFGIDLCGIERPSNAHGDLARERQAPWVWIMLLQ